MVSGNPSKAVTGTGLGLEFDNIATMSATKVDTSSNATLLSLNVTGSTPPTNGIYSPAANQLGFSTASTQRGLISAVGGWTLNAPSSGTALALSGASGAYAETVTANSTASNSFGLNVLGGTNASDAALQIVNQAGSVTFQKIFGDGHGTLGPSATLGLSWSASGNVTIAAPSSGTALTINGFTGAVPLAITADNTGNWSATFTSTSATDSRAAIAFVNNRTTAQTWAMGQNTDGGTDKSFSVRDVTRNAIPFFIANTGNITIASPSSGVGLTVSGGGVTVNAPSGNAAIATPTAGYTFGNSTDNPTYLFAGTGTTTHNGTVTGLSFIPTSATAPANGLYLAAANTVGFAANSVNIARMTSTAITGLGPVAAAQVDMTPDKGTFTCTYTGGTTAPTGTATWTRLGNLVILSLPALSATSNSTSWTYTGLPAAIQPVTTQTIYTGLLVNNAAAVDGSIHVTASSGTITFSAFATTTYSTTGWTSTGTKGFCTLAAGGLTVAYLLN